MKDNIQEFEDVIIKETGKIGTVADIGSGNNPIYTIDVNDEEKGWDYLLLHRDDIEKIRLNDAPNLVGRSTKVLQALSF